MSANIPPSLECNGRLAPLPAPPPLPHPTPAAPHPPRRGKRRVPRFGTWRWCRRPPKPSTRTPCGKIPPKSAAVCPCLTRSRGPSPGCCWRLQQRIRLTAAAVLAGVGGRVRRLPLSSRGCSTRKWPKFGHEGACVTFIRLGLVVLLPWGSQLTGRLRAPPGPAETGCNPLPHVRTAISERTIARAAAAIVSAFEAFRARSW